MNLAEKMNFIVKENAHSLLANRLKNGATITNGLQTVAVVLLKLLALQLTPRLVFLRKTEGRSQGEVPEDLMLNLRVWLILMALILLLWISSRIKWFPLGFTIFLNRSDPIWPPFVFYLWAQSLFLNGGTPILNLFSRNLVISKEDYKTKCFTETSPGTFCLQKQFQLKKHFVSRDTFNEVDEFCWQLRDEINEIIEKQVKYDVNSNLSSMEKRALRKLITEKTKSMSSMTRIKSWASERG